AYMHWRSLAAPEDVSHFDRSGRRVGAEERANHEVALTGKRQVLVDDDSDLEAVADEGLLGGRQRLDDLAQSLQRWSAAQLGDHRAVRAGDDVRLADRSA